MGQDGDGDEDEDEDEGAGRGAGEDCDSSTVVFASPEGFRMKRRVTRQ